MRVFLRGRGGNIPFWALVIALVFLPLGSLLVDAPRLYTVSIRLQSALDAAAEAAARCVDVDWYQDTGEVRLDPVCAAGEAQKHFDLVMSSLAGSRTQPTFEGLTVDDITGTVRAAGSVEVDVFFYHVTVFMRREAIAGYRMTRQ